MTNTISKKHSLCRKALRTFAFAVLGGAVSATPLYASNASAGQITNIKVNDSGVLFFDHSGVRSSLPACQAAHLNTRWAIDGNTPSGQAMIAVLLSAYAMGKPIEITGKGACPTWGDTENVTLIGLVG